MTPVAYTIAALLYDHETVIVPGLGAFWCHAESAKVNVITNQFEKPSCSLGFDASQREDNNLIVDYLMAQDGVTEEEARQALSAFVSDCYADLMAGGSVVIPDVGSLNFNDQRELVFDPVASSDFNGDAFGLEDLNPQPVFVSNKDFKEGFRGNDSEDPKKPHGRIWLWVLLSLLLLGGAFVALCYYKVIPVELPWGSKTEPIVQDTTSKVVDTIPEIVDPVIVVDTISDTVSDTIKFVADTLLMPLDTLNPVQDTVVEPKQDTVEPEVTDTVPQLFNDEPIVTPPAEMKAFIVGGCFSVEKNALNMVESVIEQGCAEAFVMKRGQKFFVCYGQYLTTADAKAALPDILKNYNNKAWILTK